MVDGEGEANRAAGTETPVMNARACDGGDFVGGWGLYFMIHRRGRDGSGERKERKIRLRYPNHPTP